MGAPAYIATKIDLSVSCRLFELNLIFANKKNCSFNHDLTIFLVIRNDSHIIFFYNINAVFFFPKVSFILDWRVISDLSKQHREQLGLFAISK